MIAITTSVFIHFYYQEVKGATAPPFRKLLGIFILAIPHQRLKHRYNPDFNTSFWGQGKHSSARKEDPRIRVYFGQLQKMCPWRLQKLYYATNEGYTTPVWSDVDENGKANLIPFDFIGR